MSETLIVRDQEKKVALEQRLSETVFKNVDLFIALYKEKIINRSNNDVKEIAEGLTEAFKNVEIKGQAADIVILNENTVYLREIGEKLEAWDLVVKIQQDISNAMKDGVLGEDDTLVFLKSKMGYFWKEGMEKRLSKEKLYFKNSDIENLYDRLSSYRGHEQQEYDEEGNPVENDEIKFLVTDFTNLDVSFIKRIYDELPG